MKGHSDVVEIVSLGKQSMTALSPADTHHWNSIHLEDLVILRVSSDDVEMPDLGTSYLVHHETWGLVVVELGENFFYHLDNKTKTDLHELAIVTGKTLRMIFVTKSCPYDYLSC